MNYDKFIEDNKEALDRFVEEYYKHKSQEKDQFQFLDDKYFVSEKEIEAINYNIVRIREAQESFRNKTIDQLDRDYGLRMAAFADQWEIPLEGERIFQDGDEAAKFLRRLSLEMGEWIHTYVKYFGYVDVLDGVYYNRGLVALLHSSGAYKAIHMGAFKQLVVLRPERDMLFIILGLKDTNPFLKPDKKDYPRELSSEKHFQVIFKEFFGTLYHIRLMLSQGDCFWIAPAYVSRRNYSTAKLQEIFLYP